MKKLFKSEENNVIFKSVLFGLLMGLGVMLLLVLGEAFLMMKLSLKQSSAQVLALLSFGSSCAVGGFCAAKKSKTKIVQVGLFTGTAIYIVTALLTFLLTDEKISSDTLLKLLVFVALSTIGAVFSAFVGNKKKYV